MRRPWLLALALAAPACEDRSACPPGVVCAAPITNNGEPVTPAALDPDRPQPPPPSAIDISRSQERAPRGTE